MVSESPKTILIAPLDWGLGHATRMLSVVRWLAERHNVLVAIPESLRFLFEEENVTIMSIPGYNIKYLRMPLGLSLFLQAPKILIRGLFTKIIIRQAVKRLNPDLIISDNRPFVRHRKTPSVYITHQLNIQHTYAPIKRIINRVHSRLINRFDECWVPDTAEHSLAGDLSDGKLNIPTQFIGGLSRFQTTSESPSEKYEKVCILSGPEPERTRWANQMKKRWKEECSALIIGAVQGKDRFEKKGNITLSSHLNDGLFMSIIKQADEIVSRSGYSTIMDLTYLKIRAELIPTKGQTEQEYLFAYYQNKWPLNANFARKDEVFTLVEKKLRG